MEEIFITGIVFASIYKVIELFIHRKERLELISKLENLNLESKPNFDLSKIFGSSKDDHWHTKIGYLLCGLGFGIIVGFFIVNMWIEVPYYGASTSATLDARNQANLVYLASSLCFGGLGLLISDIIGKRK